MKTFAVIAVCFVSAVAGAVAQQPQAPAAPQGQASAAKPLRIWMEVGEKDNGNTRDEASLHNWVMANDRMAAVLKAKGYHYQYVFAQGGGHVDRAVVTQTLPEALECLWQGYPKK